MAHLTFTPRWGDSPGLLTIAPWLLLVLIPLLLILWLSRHEARLISTGAAAALLGLRLLVLCIVLFLVLWQPVISYPAPEPQPQRVLIAVDLSASMDVHDPQRPPQEKLRLALALHLARDICSDLQLEQWLEQYRQAGAPRWLTADEYPDDPEHRHQLEEERRRQHDAVCQRVDSLNRGQLGKRVLSADGARLIAALRERFHVEVIGFAGDLRAGDPDQLEKLYEQPAGDVTDLNLPLGHALERLTTDDGKLRAVVLLTDGQHNRRTGAAREPGDLAAGLGRQGVPIHVVGLGALPTGAPAVAPAPPDVAVTLVEAPPTILKDLADAGHENLTVKATVHVSSLPAQELRIELRHGDKLLAHKVVSHPGNVNGASCDYVVPFSTSLLENGTQILTVTVPPLPGEACVTNNSRATAVKVVEDYANVLLIDGEARWEYHYLATALNLDPLVKKLDRVVFDQPRLATNSSEKELEQAGYPARILPEKDNAYAAYDCIILGDVSPEQLPLRERQRLEAFVAERGGTLVIVAGKRSMPLAFLEDTTEADPLRKRFSIRQPHVVRPPEGFPLTLTSEGAHVPLLQMEENPFLQTEQDLENAVRKPKGGDTKEGKEFQRHYWGVAGEVKPGATVLAYYAADGGATAAGRRHQREEQALLVQQHYGSGRVLYLGLDSSWRWRYKVGERFHHHFWGQLVRWAAADKLVEGGNEHVRYGTTRPRYEVGDKVEVVVRLAEDVAELAPAAQSLVRILRRGPGKEELVRVVTLKRRTPRSPFLDGQTAELGPGDYRLEPAIQGLERQVSEPPPRLALFQVTAPESLEMVELATDWPRLDRLAQQSGGHVFSAEDAERLVERLTAREEKVAKRHEPGLWQWWPMLVLLLGLLTLEWVGRKWVGLP